MHSNTMAKIIADAELGGDAVALMDEFGAVILIADYSEPEAQQTFIHLNSQQCSILLTLLSSVDSIPWTQPPTDEA